MKRKTLPLIVYLNSKLSVILLLFFILISLKAQSQMKIRRENSLYKKFTLGAHFGVSLGKNIQVPTGYEEQNSYDEVRVPVNGRVNMGASLGYALGYRFDAELGYDYQFSWLQKDYENGRGGFKRHILTPVVKYSPFIGKKSRFFIGCGVNAILSSKITFEFDGSEYLMFRYEPEEVVYKYKPTFGPLFLTGIDIYHNERISSSFSLKYNINKLHLSSFTLNGENYPTSVVDPLTTTFDSKCLFFYFGLNIHI